MAAVAALPRPAQRARTVLRGLRKRAAALAKPVRPAVANLASIPLTVAGLGCIDTGVFTASRVAGWIITGGSLMLLEHMIADEQ